MKKFFGKISDMDLTDRVLTCSPDTTIRECLQILKKEYIGCVIVIDPKDNGIIGILTERDYITKVADEDIDIGNAKVSEFMSPNPICKNMNDDLSIVAMKMLLGQFRHIIVTNDDGTLASVFSIRDILGHVIGNHLD